MRDSNIRRESTSVEVAAMESSSDISLGRGIDLSDPFSPKLKPISFNITHRETGDVIDLVTTSMDYHEVKTIKDEAKFSAMAGGVGYGSMSASARSSSFRRNVEENLIIYLVAESKGPGLSVLNRNELEWSSPPIADEILDYDDRLEQFLSDHGSHYIVDISYGWRVIVRAELSKSSNESMKSFGAALKGVSGAWSGSASAVETHRKYLERNNAKISMRIVSGDEHSKFVTGTDRVIPYLEELGNGQNKLTHGPLTARAQSYKHTLQKYPNCQQFYKVRSTVTPSAEFGVPSGTIIAWHPRSENIVKNPDDDSEVIDIKLPEGWLYCDGTQRTPDLRGAFPRGNTSLEEVLPDNIFSGGGNTHAHVVDGSTDVSGSEEVGYGTFKRKYRKNTDLLDRVLSTPDKTKSSGSTKPYIMNHGHSLRIATTESNHLPPFCSVVYIMKS